MDEELRKICRNSYLILKDLNLSECFHLFAISFEMTSNINLFAN